MAYANATSPDVLRNACTVPRGTERIGDEERPVGEGSVLYVPRGTVHAFRNTSGDVAFAYAIYVPAFDGRDRVEVK